MKDFKIDNDGTVRVIGWDHNGRVNRVVGRIPTPTEAEDALMKRVINGKCKIYDSPNFTNEELPEIFKPMI